MRNLLAFVGLVVVVFAVGGNYLGWYQFQWKPGKDGKQSFNVEVDTNKIGKDVGSGVERGGQLVKDKLQKESADPDSPNFVGPPDPKSELVGPPDPKPSRSFFSNGSPR